MGGKTVPASTTRQKKKTNPDPFFGGVDPPLPAQWDGKRKKKIQEKKSKFLLVGQTREGT